MTAILVTAVVLVGALCVLDLVLSYGIIRRLREQTRQLEQLTQGGGPPAGLQPGDPVGEFHATTTAGASVSDAALRSGTDRLVGFFSPTCTPCKEKLPDFLAYAARFGGPVLSVVSGEPDAAMAEPLATVGDTVTEPMGGPVGEAFRVRAYPTILLVDGDGRVRDTNVDVTKLPAGATA